jgi:membrane peptidoglycan carboxypeptidase
MSYGRISRSNQRFPAARRRAARYGNTRYGQKSKGLPPNLLASGRERAKPKGPITKGRVLLVASAIAAFAFVAFFIFTVITAALGVAGTISAYQDVNKNLPNAAQIAADTFQTTRIYDRNGNLLQQLENPDYGWRTFVSYDQISPNLINATVAAEDSTFWTNPGIEPLSVPRAAMIYATGAGTSGGSTITQQLARSLYPNQIGFDISFTRKGKEALAAYALTKKYSKRDIITMYVNQIFYGSRSYGIEAASQTFFNKHAKDLDLAEAAMLAGLPQAPSAYDPSVPDNFPLAKRRQRYVLDQMVKYRYITQEQADAAYKEPLHPRDNRNGAIQAAPHFTEYVKKYLIEHYGEKALYSGLQVTTSIDLDLQASAEQIVANGVRDVAVYDRNNGAMVIMVPWSGEILAMVGSADFNNQLISGQVNYADADLQPGSSIKPIVYSAAFEKGWNPATMIMDVPTTWQTPGAPDPTYTPQNYTLLNYGAVPVRTALASSLNIPAVKATDYVGVQGVLDMAHKMGMKEGLNRSADYYGLSIGLGAGEVRLVEHTNAYATLANSGKHVDIHPIIKITDSSGHVLYDLNKDQLAKDSQQVIESAHAYQITSILTDNKARSMVFTENNLFGDTQDALGRPTAAKSGTTENWKDLWTMGYTTDVVVGVWVGKSGGDNNNLPQIDGIEAAGPIWRDTMEEVHSNPAFAKLLVGPDGRPIADDFPVPSNIYKGAVCAATGHRPGSGATRTEVLVRGEGPTEACDQLNDYEQTQLNQALTAVRSGGARWTNGAVDSIYRYAGAANYSGVPNVGSSGSDNNSDTQVIVPTNNGSNNADTPNNSTDGGNVIQVNDNN